MGEGGKVLEITANECSNPLNGTNYFTMNDIMTEEEMKKCIDRTGLLYMLSDVCYSLLDDLCREFNKHGKDLRHESKYYFNDYKRKLDQAKSAAARCSKDIGCMSDQMQDYFFEDSEFLRDLNELIYKKALGSPENQARIKALIFNLKDVE